MGHDDFSPSSRARQRGSRFITVLAALLVAGMLASCSSRSGENDAASRAGGQSFEEYCAMRKHVMRDVTAQRRDGAVVVTWELPLVVSDPRTYRMLRRRAGESWERIGQVSLPVDAARRYVDEAAPADPLDYAVVEIDGCGANPVCVASSVGQMCATASVPARETD
ncbi:MAG TPA: hypothetical protein VFX33_07265 [Actinomycetales bacterium]|nr:hypothetical protein [Actinomycetales bacterium]